MSCLMKERNINLDLIRCVAAIFGKRQILRSLPNYAPLFIGGAYCNIQLEVLSTMA